VNRGSEPRLLAELSSGAVTYSSGLDLAFILRWAPVLPRVSWLWALPLLEESSDAAMCSSALDLASLPRWALALPRGPDLVSPRGELRCCHIPHGSQRAVDYGIKKGLSAPGMQLGSHVSKARSHVTEAPARHANMPLQFGLTVQRRPN
jgi:hypothetical protein